jgi:hypothetical protein
VSDSNSTRAPYKNHIRGLLDILERRTEMSDFNTQKNKALAKKKEKTVQDLIDLLITEHGNTQKIVSKDYVPSLPSGYISPPLECDQPPWPLLWTPQPFTLQIASDNPSPVWVSEWLPLPVSCGNPEPLVMSGLSAWLPDPKAAPLVGPIRTEQSTLFSIGDKVMYDGQLYEVVDSYFDPTSGETYHDITGLVVYSILSGVASINLTKYVESGLVKNKCECGAHATTYKDDHMHFCPLFTGVKP